MAQAQPDRAAEILHALQAGKTGPLIPELTARSPEEWAATPAAAQMLPWARESTSVTAIPETTYTLYRRYKVAGERPPYEGPYFEKRKLLTQEVIAAWLDHSDARMGRINDLLWSICEETTWVVPAHERNGMLFIDLFASETGCDLAQALMLLGDRLPEEIRTRVRDEIKRRIMDPYLEHGAEFSWGAGRNNWTGVCAGSIGQTFLLMEEDPARLSTALATVLEQLDRFIANAFTEDGASLEGIGYWNYGLSHYVSFAEMLRERTNGAIDPLGQEKMKAIAQYPGTVYLGNGLYASFADAHENSEVEPYLAARIAQRTGATELLGLVGGPTDWRLNTLLRNLTWWDGEKAAEPPLRDAFMPKSGIAKLVSGRAVLAIKAGHNDEPHNHNDIGSFVLCLDGVAYLCDPGGGLYNADYFSKKRYENVFANSYGHSVPRIGGKLQQTGKQFNGTMERTADKAVSIRFENAYGIPELREATRRAALQDGGLTLEDAFAFDGAGLEVEEAFLTWQKVEVNSNVARVSTGKGTLEITADQGVFTAEPLTDACKATIRRACSRASPLPAPPRPTLPSASPCGTLRQRTKAEGQRAKKEGQNGRRTKGHLRKNIRVLRSHCESLHLVGSQAGTRTNAGQAIASVGNVHWGKRRRGPRRAEQG